MLRDLDWLECAGGAGPRADAGHGADRRDRFGAPDFESVLDAAAAEAGPHFHDDFVPEAKRIRVFAVRADTRPMESIAGDAQASGAPQRVLGFFHVAEEGAEVRDAG